MTYLVRLDLSAFEYHALLVALDALEERSKVHPDGPVGPLLEMSDRDALRLLMDAVYGTT